MNFLKHIIIGFFLFLILTSTIKTTEQKHIEIPDYLLVKLWANYYSKEYKISKNVVYNVLKKETKWKDKDSAYIAEQEGDFYKDKKIKKFIPKAFGPGQIHFLTAKGIWKDSIITIEKLKNNIQFNIQTTVLILKDHYDYFKDVKNKELRWKYTITSYNTGIPSFERNGRNINNYALEIYSKSF